MKWVDIERLLARKKKNKIIRKLEGKEENKK